MPSARTSAGLLMYRRRGGALEVFLVHPGGPYFRSRDTGAWTLPKGEPEPDEPLLDAARREFAEETGVQPPEDLLPLGSVTQKGGKVVHAWAFEGDRDEGLPLHSNAFEMEWPPRSGRQQSFPEIDRGGFFDLERARELINPAQAPLLERLAATLGG